jgi:hypothetical protein
VRILHILAAIAALSLSSAAFAQTPDQPNGAPVGSGSNPPGGDVQGGRQVGGGGPPSEGGGMMMHHRRHYHHHYYHHRMHHMSHSMRSNANGQ